MKKVLSVLLSLSLLLWSYAAFAENNTSYDVSENENIIEDFCESDYGHNHDFSEEINHSNNEICVNDYINVYETDYDKYAYIEDVGNDYALIERGHESSNNLIAASSHKHSLTTQYTYVDSGKHSYQKKCTTCGKITSKGTQPHQAANTNGTNASSKDSKKHTVSYTCKLCGKNYTKETSHTFSAKIEKNGNDGTYHNVVKYCKTCGYRGTTTKAKHVLSNGTCSKCGYQNSSKVYKAGGVCSTYLGKSWNDLNIYKNCPKCGSYSAKFVKLQTIKKNQAAAGGRKVTVYHQHVKCNSCGKQYCNRCYAK